jgi:putative phage-type endonuclease
MITASCMADAMAKSRDGKGEGVTRANLRMKLVLERVTGKPCENGYTNKAMEKGAELEPLARAAYESKNRVLVHQIGFAIHSELPFLGASPDGLVGQEGGVEIKCPFPKTHWEYRKAGIVPAEYVKQVLCGMAVCERPWWDFVSYCPDFPSPLDLFIVRMYRDTKRIAEIEDAAIQLDREICTEVSAILKMVEEA